MALAAGRGRGVSDVKTPPRKLVDLHPTFYGAAGTKDGSTPERRGVGVIFDCPCLADDCAWGGKIAISFSNPLDGGAPYSTHSAERHWQRTGETFETMTLSPSIHAVGHWHGWLKDGVLLSC